MIYPLSKPCCNRAVIAIIHILFVGSVYVYDSVSTLIQNNPFACNEIQNITNKIYPIRG
jgi:hypothetical protein